MTALLMDFAFEIGGNVKASDQMFAQYTAEIWHAKPCQAPRRALRWSTKTYGRSVKERGALARDFSRRAADRHQHQVMPDR
jgi:hypothetical protein